MALTRDAEQTEQARHLQLVNPGWVVLWSAWRRAYTAFACFTPIPIILDHTAADQLVVQMRRAELSFAPPRHGSPQYGHAHAWPHAPVSEGNPADDR